MIYDDNLQVMKIKQMLLTRKVVLVGYSIPFFSKYANMINFSIGFTGSNKKEMQSIDKNSTLEFFHISEFSKIHADDGYMLIACTSAKDWDYNKHLYEKQLFYEIGGFLQ